MAQPENPAAGIPAGELAGSVTKALLENAQRLGLTWTLRLATVTTITVNSPGVMCTFDGDSEAIAMTNMTGWPLVVDQRVWVIILPPGGNYIVGIQTVEPAPAGALSGRIGIALESSAAKAGTGPTTETWAVISEHVGRNFGIVAGGTTVTIPLDGLYAISYRQSFTVNGARNFCSILVGATVVARDSWTAVEDTGSCSITRRLVAGDTVTFNVFMSTGGAWVSNGRAEVYRVGN